MRRTPLLLAAFLAGSFLAAPSSSPAASVVAGPLGARISSPWSLTFVERTQGATLRTTGIGGTGQLGFRTAAGWFRARRLLSQRTQGASLLARLATNDPAGRVLAVRLAPEAEGVIALEARVEGGAASDVQALGIAFRAEPAERFLGFGERSNAVDQRGREVESYVADGPYQQEEYELISAFVPRAGVRRRDDATYFPMPWLLSTRGYGVLVDNPQTSRFRLGSEREDAWSVEVESGRLALRVFAGPRPADVLRRLTQRIGRQPPPAAPFYFGPWYQPRRGDYAAELELLLDRDVPLSLGQTYTHYLPCGDQRDRQDAERERIARFHRSGLAVTTYFNPMICTGYRPVYDEAVSRGALNVDAAGAPYTYLYTGSTVFDVAQFDFGAPAGRRHFRRLLGEAIEDGYDGWMEDFGEYTPLDARSQDGTTGSALHNLYPLRYHCAAYGVTRSSPRPLARFQRSGWTGVAPCAQIVWGGDPTTSWGFDGLRSAVTQALTIGLSGISRWGSDIGGFFALDDNRLTSELLIRWIQLGAVSGVMRTQANGFALPPDKPRPQISDADVLPHWRRWAKLRTQLYPYLAAADAEYRRSGLPVMRHLALAYPRDARAVVRDDEFLFGPDLLAAPVLDPGARRRAVYLPPGDWVDLWRSAGYGERSGGLYLRRARVLAGSRSTAIPAPLGELPLLARRGAVLALLPPDVDTLAGYGGGERQLRLRDRRSRLDLLAFPSGRSETLLEDGARLVSRELRGRWALTVGPGRVRTFRLQASLGTLRRPLRPCRVTFAGRPLPARAWSYDTRASVLRARFRGPGRLVVSACARR